MVLYRENCFSALTGTAEGADSISWVSSSKVLDRQLLLSTRTSENEVQSWQLKQNPTTVCSTLSVAHYTLHIGTRETWFPALVVDASVTRSLASLGNIVTVSAAHYTLVHETWFPALAVDASVARSLASLGIAILTVTGAHMKH